MSNKRSVLSTCRKSKGTLKDVSHDLGISTVYLRMIENGTFLPGRDLMFKISIYLEKPVEVLFPDYFQNLVDNFFIYKQYKR